MAPVAPMPSVVVLVPARNEGGVIAAVVADLAAQDIATRSVAGGVEAAFRVVVIDDGSADDTAVVAHEAGAALGPRLTVVRHTPSTTKAAALEAGTDALGGLAALDPATVVVVLDADARVAPDFVRQTVEAADGHPATARRRMLAPPAGRWARRFARLQDDEQSVDLELRRWRWALGGGSELRGDGMVLPVAALQAVGSWPVEATCEDLELSTALALDAGLAIRPLDVEVWEQPVLDPAAFVDQRLRWAEGAIERDLRLVWPRLGDATLPVGRRLEAGAYAAQTLLGVGLVGLAMAGRPGRRLARGITGAYLAAGFALAVRAVAAAPEREGRRIVRAATVTAFGALWPIVTAVAWLRVVAAAAARRRGGQEARVERHFERRFEVTPKRPGFSAPWDGRRAGPAGGGDAAGPGTRPTG